MPHSMHSIGHSGTDATTSMVGPQVQSYFWWASATILALTGCSADLPDGWDGAVEFRVEQTECRGEHITSRVVDVQTELVGGALHVSLTTNMVRCGEKACGYHERDGGIDRVLFQPCDMHPDDAVLCSCAYGLSGSVTLGRSQADVEVYVRGDAYAGDPGPPQLVSSAHLSEQ